MANRHKVIYVEARSPKAGTFPGRTYFSSIIDIILTNLNERDSINRAKANPWQNKTGTRYAQLSGIENKDLERRLQETQRSINEDDSTLKANDVNLIIDTTADLIRTIAPFNRVEVREECTYWRNEKIVPLDTGVGTSPVLSTNLVSKLVKYTTDSGQGIRVSGYSNTNAKIVKSISGAEVEPFGSMPANTIHYIGSITKDFKVIGLFTAQAYNGITDTATKVGNPRNFIVFENQLSDFPEDMSGIAVTVGSTVYSIERASIKETADHNHSYAEIANTDPTVPVFTEAETTYTVKLQAVVNMEETLTQDARICTLTYNPANSSTACENRSILHGFRLTTQENATTVQICNNTLRRVSRIVVNPNTDFTIEHVNAGETVYASKWALIAEYLRRISQQLDTYNGWWDDNGYCNITCQTHCQSTCQLSCQGCYSNTCHNQNCGMS